MKPSRPPRAFAEWKPISGAVAEWYSPETNNWLNARGLLARRGRRWSLALYAPGRMGKLYGAVTQARVGDLAAIWTTFLLTGDYPEDAER